MKEVLIIVFTFLSFNLSGQVTYSKVYDFDKAALRNYIRDMIVVDDNIITQLIQFCPQDSIYFVCGTLAKFNLNGDLIIHKINYQSNAFFDGQDCLGYSSGSIYYATNLLGEHPNITTIYKYDMNLNEQTVFSYLNSQNSPIIDNRGICIIENNMYIYGDISNESGVPDSIRIIKTDLNGNEIWRKYYSYGNSSLDMNNLQATQDDNLAFILRIQSPSGANNGFNGRQLMKIDTSGSVLDSIVFPYLDQQPNRLLATSDGTYVFSSLDHPFDGFDPTSYGMINKMDSELDTLEWSLILPNNRFVDGRYYRMFDYTEASNGDIVACGMAFDNTDSEISYPDKNCTWNGFIVRLSPTGEIIWLHLYKHPNNLVPQDEYGLFFESRLNEIKELPDGRFIAVGDVSATGSQLSVINEEEKEAFFLWLLMVDENGCIEGKECNEIIYLGNKKKGNYSKGDTWTYEEKIGFRNGHGQIGYIPFSITGTIIDGNLIKYVINDKDTFYIKNDKMYFWDKHYQDYIMYYDFNATTPYDIKYFTKVTKEEKVATVIIDSISYKHFGNDTIKVQHVHILNSGTFPEYTDVVYEGIGAGHYGIKFNLGCGLCDFSNSITKLRCFNTDTMLYSFVPYACDTTWFITSTINPIEYDINIFPNPTTGRIYIEGLNGPSEYNIYDLSGRLIQRGIVEENGIYIEESGVAILELVIGKSRIRKKIVVIK